MALTEQFKNECERVLNAWNTLLGYNWGNMSWDDLNTRAKAGRDKILADPFFTSLKNKTTEEQKYFWKQVIFYYYDKGGSTPNNIYSLNYCWGSLRGNAGAIGSLAVIFFDLRNDFARMIDVDKWDAEAVNWAKKYEEQWTYYKTTLRKDYLNDVPFYPDGLKEVKKVLDQLKADKTQLTTDRDTAQTSLKSWTDTFGTLKPAEVKTEYDKPKEQHTPDQLEKHTAEDLKPADYDQIKGDLKTANEKITTLEADKTNLNNTLTSKNTEISNLTQQLSSKDTSITELNTKLTNKDNELTTANNSITTLTSDKQKAEQERDNAKTDLTTANNKITTLEGEKTTLTNENEQLKKREQAQETINNAWKNAFGETYGDRPTLGSLNLLASKLKEKDGEITKLNQQLTQQGNQAGDTARYLNKLLAVYRTEITDETTKFYQTLKLDNNEVNEKYGNRAITYLEKLKEKELNGESEPEQVINAFKYVALILAVEKAQKESDEWINKPVANTPAFKKSKYNAFNKIKDAWSDMDGVAEPTADNNPLYLPVIKDKNQYITKLNNIIKLWQP